MKSLYLMRHAKSSWSFEDLTDEQRPLNGRGREDAPRMGQALAKRNIQLDLLLSSAAVRALTTAALVAKELNYSHEQIVVRPEIYHADVHTLLDVVRSCPDKANSVLLVGHNNTISDFANLLSPGALHEEMPTAGIVCLHVNVHKWVELDQSNTEFYFFDRPRDKPREIE
ncbi:histidine phosphatase family protein [Hymenobacter sp.]|jgi:phosphohistidine phosphatase|uniref:SixA phosphatase family protein n=1 Tax=Hymenobacter sp. TaxID=1898978 RepID=UPI002EDA8D90